MVLLNNIRSAYNVGSIFRSAESAGVDRLFLTGYTAIPPHPKLDKTALGSIESVNWEHHCDPLKLAQLMKNQGVMLWAMEPTETAASIYELDVTGDICLVFGHEETGVMPELLALADQVVKIPQFGLKESLNVAVAAGVAIYECKRKLLEKC